MRCRCLPQLALVLAETPREGVLVIVPGEAASPVEVDYLLLAGAARGSIQRGVMEWRGPLACFNMAPAGGDRPADFTCPAGSGRTLSLWRPAK